MDNTGAAIPDVSIQVSERGIPMDIWITFRDGWKRDARDSGKLSHVKILRMEEERLEPGLELIHRTKDGLQTREKKNRFAERNCRSAEP